MFEGEALGDESLLTAEYVDVEARLKALNDQRDRLNALADKAETTADLLEIESQLSDVQYQLESYTGQMRLMDNQVRYSTVDISPAGSAGSDATAATTFGEKFVEAVTSGWRGFVDGAEDLILVVVYLWPVVLIVLAILLVALDPPSSAARPAGRRKSRPSSLQRLPPRRSPQSPPNRTAPQNGFRFFSPDLITKRARRRCSRRRRALCFIFTGCAYRPYSSVYLFFR